MVTDNAILWWGQWSSAVHWRGCNYYHQSTSSCTALINSLLVGGGWVSGLHSIALGSGLHISVSKHITILIEGLYPVSHWRVAADPGNLLVNELNTPLEELVKFAGQPPERVSAIIVYSITDSTHQW